MKRLAPSEDVVIRRAAGFGLQATGDTGYGLQAPGLSQPASVDHRLAGPPRSHNGFRSIFPWLLSLKCRLSSPSGGVVFPISSAREICVFAGASEMRTYLDGARWWNASVATGIPVSELAAPLDLVAVALSKGSCPASSAISICRPRFPRPGSATDVCLQTAGRRGRRARRRHGTGARDRYESALSEREGPRSHNGVRLTSPSNAAYPLLA